MHLKVKPAFYTLAFLFACLPVSATSVLVIVTPAGIVVAADSEVVTVDTGGYTAPPQGPLTKIFIIHDRIAVGTVGIAGAPQLLMTSDDRPLFNFDPFSWFSEIEKKTPKDVSVRRFVEIIKNESRSAFSPLNDLIKKGAFEREETRNLKIQYLVCGFDSGIAVVEEVNFRADWENRQLIGPVVEPVFPDPDARVDFGFHAASMSQTLAVDDVVRRKTDSEGFKSVAAESGAELSILLARKDLSLNQASALLHAILRAQHKYTPKAVGPPYNVVWLCKDGTMHRIDYSD